MRTRVAILAVVLAAALTACSDGDDKPATRGAGSPGTPTTDHTTVDCAEFAETAKKIADAQADVYAGGGRGAVDALVAELDELKDGAPADVQAALDDLADAFGQAAQIMTDPTDENKAELAALGPKLSEDGRTITAYIVSKCS